MQTTKRIRFLGVVLTLIGLFLVGLMGTIAYDQAPMLLNPGSASRSGSRFTGTPEQGQKMLLLFAAVIGFGLMSIVGGLWQIVTGRRNKWMVIAMVGVFILVAIGASLVREAFAGR